MILEWYSVILMSWTRLCLLVTTFVEIFEVTNHVSWLILKIFRKKWEGLEYSFHMQTKQIFIYNISQHFYYFFNLTLMVFLNHLLFEYCIFYNFLYIFARELSTISLTILELLWIVISRLTISLLASNSNSIFGFPLI